MMTKNTLARLTVLTVLLLGVLAGFGDTKGKEPAPRFHAKTYGWAEFHQRID
jgi:hypothetical protein